MKKVILFLVIIGVIAACAAWYLRRSNGLEMTFRTVKIERGDLLATINATGTVEPEEVIDVGAQVAGLIESFGKDVNGKEIDYGSVVDEGTVLAEIDDSLYTAQLAEVTAQLEQAKANVQNNEANLKQMEAKLYQAQRDWERAQKLGPSEALAQTSYDSYKSAYDVAKANIAVGEAAILQAKASVAQAEAVLQGAQRNLGYCTIKSPVKGVIIDRRVNIGQTVVASLNAPSLFLIAKDLRRMQIWVAVNEMDIGRIYPSQPVTFTVEAFPGQVFKGQVGQVRLNASMTQNIVTYVVEVNTDNSDGKLLPYLTANVNFELSRRDNVLLVPNAALRWFPSAEQVAPAFRDSEIVKNAAGSQDPQGQGSQRSQGPQGSRSSSARRKAPVADANTPSTMGILWVRDEIYVKPLQVQVGSNDGTMTEVSGADVQEGLDVIVGEQTKNDAAGNTTTNPFTPQFRRH
jgi:HlyD family secretion protein